jgi:hypothetical protein
MSYLYKPRHSPRAGGSRPAPVVAVAAVLAIAAGLGATTLPGPPAPPGGAAPHALTGVESTLGGTGTAGAAKPSAAAPSAAAPSAAPPPPPAATAPAQKDLSYQFAWQENFYYCGPAAARIALTALGLSPSQSQLAQSLGTTVNGTNSADDITRALNSYTGTSRYRSRFIAGRSASQADIDQLRESVLDTIGRGYPVVANIAGSAVDDGGHAHAYPGGHYLTVVGYRDGGRTVRIADPADALGVGSYTLPIAAMAHWIALRGYSAAG